MKNNLKTIIILLFAGLVYSCNSVEENVNSFKPDLIEFDEFTVPIPPYMTNAWNITSEVPNSDTKNIIIWDDYKKTFFEYSIDKKAVVDSLVLNSDTLNLNGFNTFAKNNRGYFIETNFDFFWLDKNGQLLSNWSKTTRGSKSMKNHDYTKAILGSDGLKQSILNSTSFPLGYRLINERGMGVYEDVFYEFPVLGSVDMETGEVIQYEVYFPKDEYLIGEESFPTLAFLQFTACGKDCLAFSFRIDDKIHILNIKSGEVRSHSLKNEYFDVEIAPISKSNFENQSTKMAYYSSTSRTYGKNFYNPYTEGFVRVGSEKIQGNQKRICEIINKDMEIVGYTFLPDNYFLPPLFFEDEILFPYFQGYKEDEMKFVRIKLDNN
ncbi:hypothetical protein ACFCT7_16410 [Fulvivirgaceae bacterium LMO-SS25]